MNRDDFKSLSKLRLKEARILLDNNCYEGAYYLAGYSVECALKACIAKNVKRYDFPERNYEKNFYTHNLIDLIRSAGLYKDFETLKKDSEFNTNWAVVKDWSIDHRYKNTIPQTTAKDLFTAITARKHGVMTWLRKCW